MDKVLKLPAYNPQTPTFSDVSADDWYDQAVEAAVYAGIVKGYGDTTFRPGNHITREELACGLVQAMGQQDEAEASMSAKTSFTDDAGVSGWARGFVVAAVRDGLLKGYPDGSFRPHGDATRVEACAMIENFLKRPVDWYPWGDEAFDKAKREGKPGFLSIGYSTCHWCHVGKQSY